jgi:hypothetical protein
LPELFGPTGLRWLVCAVADVGNRMSKSSALAISRACFPLVRYIAIDLFREFSGMRMPSDPRDPKHCRIAV